MGRCKPLGSLNSFLLCASQLPQKQGPIQFPCTCVPVCGCGGCLCVYVPNHIHTGVHVCVVCARVYACTCMFMCVCMHAHTCVHVHVVCACVHAHVCSCACRFMWCIWMFLEVFVCACRRVHACVPMCTRAHVCAVCIHVRVGICV